MGRKWDCYGREGDGVEREMWCGREDLVWKGGFGVERRVAGSFGAIQICPLKEKMWIKKIKTLKWKGVDTGDGYDG